jgi:predicted nucleic acid-binding protein
LVRAVSKIGLGPESPRPRRRKTAGIYLVDTNIYIRAFRDAVFGERFRAWHRDMTDRLALSVVVLHELMVGATDDRRRELIERVYPAEFLERRRLLIPSQFDLA